jgi:Flp pilus assembly CpaF family ATPase
VEAMIDFIKKTEAYFTTMDDIRPELREEIKRLLQAAAHGDHDAKEVLARQLQSHFEDMGEVPTESLYPNVPVYLSLIYRTFGQGVLDAVLFQSPWIESVWIIENRPIAFTENGQLKTYDYIPSSDEVDVLLNKLAHIAERTIHQKHSAVSGSFSAKNLRLQMYTHPRSARTIIVRRHNTGYFTLDTMEMDDNIRALLKQIAASNSSIIIAGGQEAGKTTLLRAMILEKNPQTNTLTIIEQEPELRISELWGIVVIETRYVEEEPFEVSFGHAFRNTTRSIAVGESRYPFEAHYVLESGLRSPGFTFTTVHLKNVSPEQAMRTFESLVYQYRKNDRIGIRQDIADGIEFFIMLDKDDWTGKRYVTSIFCPTFQEESGELKATHLVYFDKEKETYIWTGEKIPAEKRRLFTSVPEVDIRTLEGLGVW